MRVFLIGFTGSGKTTTGKFLAEKLGLRFIDIDHYIYQKYGQTVSEIFEEKGEFFFREIEMRALHALLNEDNYLLATGGGTPCFYDNMQRMNTTGITVYLEADEEYLVQNLKDSISRRALLRLNNIEDLRQFVRRNLQKRIEFYQKAKIKVSVESLNVDNLVNQLKHR